MTPLLARDGLVARESNDYAIDKLYYVERYQEIFATGMKNIWTERAYIDLMAGSGACIIEQTGEEFAGSPIRSLAANFTHRVFVEQDPGLAAALRQRAGNGPVILQGDANAPAIIKAIRAACPPTALTMVFVDNLGLNVTFETLRLLTVGRKMDLFIVLQVQDLTRNLKAALSGQDRDRWDRFFGNGTWVECAKLAHARNASDGEVANDLVDYYAERLGTIGYEVELCREVMKNRRNAAQYRLMLAGKDPKAIEFFRKIAAIESDGQRGLPYD